MKKAICITLAAVLSLMLTSCGIFNRGREQHCCDGQTITVNVKISEPCKHSRVTIDFYMDENGKISFFN